MLNLGGGCARVRSGGGPRAAPPALRGGLALAPRAAARAARRRRRARARARARAGRRLVRAARAISPSSAASSWPRRRCKALSELPGELDATLYHDRFDPRVRSTRLLLASLAASGRVKVRERLLSDSPEELDRFGIASSNTVVLELGTRFETVERPLEGALYEALYRLRSRSNGVIGVLRGEGEGDVSSDAELGFSGLAAALSTEGYQVRSPRHGFARRDPRGRRRGAAAGAPARAAAGVARDASSATSNGAVACVALLEPGVQSGIEAVLDRWGIRAADGVIVDPASGAPLRRGPGHRPDRLQLRVAPGHARPERQPHDVLRRRATARAAQHRARRTACGAWCSRARAPG